MLYAREVIELMAAYPGRDFRMREIVRYAMRGRETNQRHKIRVGVARVLLELERSGAILRRPPRAARGGYAEYRWR